MVYGVTFRDRRAAMILPMFTRYPSFLLWNDSAVFPEVCFDITVEFPFTTPLPKLSLKIAQINEQWEVLNILGLCHYVYLCE